MRPEQLVKVDSRPVGRIAFDELSCRASLSLLYSRISLFHNPQSSRHVTYHNTWVQRIWAAKTSYATSLESQKSHIGTRIRKPTDHHRLPAMSSFLNLPPELREAIYIEVIRLDSRGAVFNSTSRKLTHPSSLRLVCRQVDGELSAPIHKHAPLVIFPVLDLAFEEVTTWINELSDPTARTLSFSPGERNPPVDTKMPSAADSHARELRIELRFNSNNDTVIFDLRGMEATLRTWSAHFTNPALRFARLNLTYDFSKMSRYARVGFHYLSYCQVCMRAAELGEEAEGGKMREAFLLRCRQEREPEAMGR